VKEGSENGHLSPYGPCWRTWTGAHLPGTLETQMDSSGNGASLSLSLPLLKLCKGNLKRGILYWDLEGYVQEGRGNEHLSP